MIKDKMQLIDDLVTGGKTCVLATVDDNRPHTSLMTYFADHAVMKFYFLTRKTSQKYKNLKKNPHVSLLIDWRERDMAVSIDGHYSPIKKKQTAAAITRLFLMRHPGLEAFANHPDTELIRVLGTSAELALGKEDIFSTKLKNT